MNADAGLRAVARVRGVRESDSRIGLTTALGEHRAAQARVDELRHRLETASTFVAGSAPEFLALRTSLAALGDVLIAAESARDGSRTVSDAALARWQVDKSRLSAIEMLLERRAADRRTDAARREARELDDLAAQRWSRQRDGGVHR
ncbi:MAG: flagellar export protein FliJ [Marmoricola sp.]